MNDNTKLQLIQELAKGNVKIGQLIMEVHGDNHFHENESKDTKYTEGPDVPSKVATKEMMSKAAKVTLDGGYWKSQRSWAITFIVYCIWGYKGRVSDFLIEVPEWPDGVAQRMLCNRDAVEKLKNMYNFSNDIKEWRGNGVPEQYCILGEQLDAELERMLPKYTFSEE